MKKSPLLLKRLASWVLGVSAFILFFLIAVTISSVINEVMAERADIGPKITQEDAVMQGEDLEEALFNTAITGLRGAKPAKSSTPNGAHLSDMTITEPTGTNSIGDRGMTFEEQNRITLALLVLMTGSYIFCRRMPPNRFVQFFKLLLPSLAIWIVFNIAATSIIFFIARINLPLGLIAILGIIGLIIKIMVWLSPYFLYIKLTRSAKPRAFETITRMRKVI